MIALAVAAVAMVVPAQQLRYERTLQPAGAGPAEVIPDGPMLEHARSDFSDVRIADASGEQVPWRALPPAQQRATDTLPVLDAGRRGELAVARVDLGARHTLVERVMLDIPDARFHGRVTVFGSDDRRTWTQLSTTEIYSVGGARPARSTTALLPPTDFRYLELRATHVSRIIGASVARKSVAPALRPVAIRRVRHGNRTVVIDLGYRNTPVDELRIASSTPRYARSFTVRVRGDVVAAGELVRVGGTKSTIVPLAVRTHFLALEIDNGDDPPLRAIRVDVLAQPRTLLVEGGHPGPLTLFYGGNVRAPTYDFARLPRSTIGLERARIAVLGRERANNEYRAVDNRSFVRRHMSLVTLALVLAAASVMGAAALTLRRA